MKRVLNPIYPVEIERNCNGHIRSRAYTGCIEDKKWYGLIGSGICSKGIETKLNADPSVFYYQGTSAAANTPIGCARWFISN